MVFADATVLLVDGYNVIGACPQLQRMRDRESLELARDQLIQSMSNYSAFQGYLTRLVFDAQYRNGQGTREQVTESLHIHYTDGGQTADTQIERFCAQSRQQSTRVIVATSDRAQKLTVIGYGAEWMSAQQLLQDIQAVTRRIQTRQQSVRETPGRLLAHAIDPSIKHRLEQWRRGGSPVQPSDV